VAQRSTTLLDVVSVVAVWNSIPGTVLESSHSHFFSLHCKLQALFSE